MSAGLLVDQRRAAARNKRRAEPDRPDSRRGRRTREALAGWGFIGPAVAVIIGLTVFPAGWAFLLSRQEWNGFTNRSRWAGRTTSG